MIVARCFMLRELIKILFKLYQERDVPKTHFLTPCVDRMLTIEALCRLVIF